MDKHLLCLEESKICDELKSQILPLSPPHFFTNRKESVLSVYCQPDDRCRKFMLACSQNHDCFLVGKKMLTVFSQAKADKKLKEQLFCLKLERKKCDEFTKEEVKYLSRSVFREVYSFEVFTLDTLKLDFFNFTLNSAEVSDPVPMCMRYRVCYGLIVRCKQIYFCSNDSVFKKVIDFFNWRRNVLSGYCYVKFRSKETLLPTNCHSSFETLNKFCYDYYMNSSTKSRFINMSRFMFFMTKLLSDVFQCRLVNRSLIEE